MHAFYQNPSTSKIDPSIQAETKCVMLLIRHNSLFNKSVYLSPLIRTEFRGSQAAENFSFGRTKTAVIVKWTASARSYKIGVVGNNWLVGW